MDNIFVSFFNHALPRFHVRPVLPDCRVEADWLKCAAPPNKVTLLASRHPFCHMVPYTPSLHTAYKQQQLLCRGLKAGVRRVSRTDFDLLMQTVTKKYLYGFRIKPLGLREACSQNRTWNGWVHCCWELNPSSSLLLSRTDPLLFWLFVICHCY
jgi:hypothetical protein